MYVSKIQRFGSGIYRIIYLQRLSLFKRKEHSRGRTMRLPWATGTHLLLVSLPLAGCYSPLSNDQSAILKSTLPLPISSYLSPKSSSLLSPILIPRPSDSEGATRTLNHFINFFTHNVSNWIISLDKFTDSTPRGNLKFTNFIATRDPPGIPTGAAGRLVVTAHYDSKWFAKGTSQENFIGAIDSAVPCAMLMYAALALDEFLSNRDEQLRLADIERLDDNPIGLQVNFVFSVPI
jgi:glutaminyl-peptide cyclotransferase